MQKVNLYISIAVGVLTIGGTLLGGYIYLQNQHKSLEEKLGHKIEQLDKKLESHYHNIQKNYFPKDAAINLDASFELHKINDNILDLNNQIWRLEDRIEKNKNDETAKKLLDKLLKKKAQLEKMHIEIFRKFISRNTF